VKTNFPGSFEMSPDVARALNNQFPIVALETTVITHGLPAPENLELAAEVEVIVKNNGALPATIGLLEGRVMVGMQKNNLESLVQQKDPVKVSSRNLGICIAQKLSGGTTVAGTLVVCRTAGIQVFATGGIGGVHRGSNFDISADLDELARSPVIVVCAGAKAILDLPATLEVLETRGVPVIGYRTSEFPAFYSINSGLPVDIIANSPAEIAAIARSHWELGLHSAILVCVPPPADVAMDASEVDEVLEKALHQSKVEGITRGRLTPYLLDKMSVLTHGKSLQTNLALLRNNATLAAEIAVQLSQKSKMVNF
jgi:pseudouridylate synthase